MREPDIGSDATLAGLDDGPGASTSRSRSAASSQVRPLTLPRDLPAHLDRSTLTPAERALEVSRYVLLSRLGAGGMGLVYLAWDPALDRKVALKLLRPGDDREPAAEAHTRLHREAQALARLSHPNVVAVHDVGTYDARPLYGEADQGGGDGVFVVMAYIEGVTLQRWLDERPRPWRQVLALFLAAGRGLAAAHAVGILHRDFKPSNVLVKADGSVHVFDFGLARAAHELHGAFDPPPDGSMSLATASLSVSFASPLTQIGAVVGTPVYMAPEQRGGEGVDARADQFSFCVALYEGLHGARPFSGENFYALEVAKLSGTIDPPRRAVRIPRRLHRAVLRGLAGEPKDRWPSMLPLLAELERIDPPRRRGRRFAALGLAVGLVAGVSAVAMTRPPLCTGAAAALGDAWDPQAAATLERAFLATGLPYAQTTWQRTHDRLGRYASAWLDTHHAACAATNIDRTASAERMDRRMRCLDRARDELAALVTVLSAADVEVVDNAVAAVAALTPVGACEDPGETPPDPTESAQISLAAAELHAGHHEASRALASASMTTAEATADRSSLAAAGRVLGDALVALSAYPEAERTLVRAYFDAVATGRDELAAAAAIDLVSLLGDRLARPDEGRAWARHADALLDRLARPAALEAHYLQNLGNLHARSGAYADAEPLYRQALARMTDDQPIDRVGALDNLASAIAYLGRIQESIDLFEQALALREATLGPDHPRVGQTLTNLGGSYALLGDNDRSESIQLRALHNFRASLPPRHELLAFPLSALGDVALGRSEFSAALDYFEEARGIWEHNFGAEHPSVATMHERLATTRLLQGDLDAARLLADRAVDLWTRLPAPEPLQLAMARLVRSQIAAADADFTRARALAETARSATAEFGEDNLYCLAARLQLAQIDLEAAERDAAARPGKQRGPSAPDPRVAPALAAITTIVAVMERDHGQGARWLAEPLVVLARAHLLLGDAAAARAALARAAPIAESARLAATRAEIDLVLARATVDVDPTRAHDLALAARAVLRRIGARRSLADAETWLRDHPAP